ncbi:MAG: SagB family peptide dehydrogenase [Deltaproteobacteria bacterium]|nr:SagB family peptide dehydrogenase [Deltaproteobacteria bacterium]
MSPRLALRLSSTTTFEAEASDEITLVGGLEGAAWRPRVTLKQLTPGLMKAIKGLAAGDKSVSELSASVIASDGFAAIGKLRVFLKKIEEHAFIQYDLFLDDGLALSLVPVSLSFRRAEKLIDPTTKYVLSRFSYERRDEAGRLVVASPTSHAVVYVQQPKIALALFKLGQPASVEEVAVAAGMDLESATFALEALANAGAIEAVSEAGTTRADTDPALGQWAFADLLFHTSSRLGRHSNPFGATQRNAARGFSGLPILKSKMSDQITQLPRPDMELRSQGPSFSDVLENRRTVRTYGDKPITLDQLGEFLYRSARIKKVVEAGGVTWRPSPGGGGIHETELYPIVMGCEGLGVGAYHYNPMDHTLERLAANEGDLYKVIEMARMAAMLDQPAQVLLVIAARFQRIQNKYDSVGYSVMMKNIGALYQTMYLVAESMGLAGCALGGGDSDLFTKISGTDYYAETSIGEFLLGSGPDPRPAPLTPPARMARS